jgi:hypothetical protein
MESALNRLLLRPAVEDVLEGVSLDADMYLKTKRRSGWT